MIGKKINQLATELAPVSTDLTIIGDPISGVSKKITLAQLGAIFSGAVSFYDNLASFPAVGDINVIYCAKDTKKLYLWSGSAYVEVFPSQALLDTYQLRSEKGNANGYASLDSLGKVPISQLPSSLMEYLGTWNASTNTPTLANGTGDNGDVYLCNVAGTVNFGAGPITFSVGDWVIYNGTIWERSSGAVGTVTSVAVSRSGDALAITGSPVTTSGTINIGFAGTGAQYIKGDGTLATFPNTIDQAKNLITEVYNSTGAILTKGTVVYINGGQGNLPTITKALATGDSTSAQTYGIVQNDITNNNNGYVVVAGRLSDIDTQAFSVGTQLYLSSTTAGAYTSTKQYAPAHLVYVGIIVRSHPTQGIIEVKIQNGYELDELHNVAAQTPTNNDGLFWESSTSLWKNKSLSTILGGTPVTGSGTTNRLTKWSSTSGQIVNSNILDTGITITNLNATADFFSCQFNGNATTGKSYGVLIAAGTNSSDIAFRIEDVSSSNVYLYVWGDGRVQMNNIPNATTDTDKFLVSDSGVIKYRTGAELLSDIGGASASGYVPYTGATTNLNLGSNNLTAAAITGTSARITTLAGSVYADVNGNLGTTSGTQDTLTYWASQYSIASLSTATYPSLTELSYVKGVTSSIQTQLNAKQNALTNPVTGTGTTNYLPKFTGASTIGNSAIQDDGTDVTITGRALKTGGIVSSAVGGAANQEALRIYNDNGYIGFFNSANTTRSAYIQGNTTDLTLNTSLAIPILFGTSNVTKMTLSASGNLGLGVTPSAWDTSTNVRVLQMNAGSLWGFSTTAFLMVQNSFSNTSGVRTYVNNGFASEYEQASGQHIWQTAPSGTAGNAISFTQAMTLNASGNLSLGNTNDTYKLDVTGTGRFGGTNTYNGFLIGSHSNNVGAAIYNKGNAAQTLYADNSSTVLNAEVNLYLRTGNTDRLTIASTGAATFSSSVRAGTHFQLSGRTTSYGYQFPDWQIYNTTGGGLAFNNYSSDLLTIASSGSVGIGTTSPGSLLDVVTSTAYDGVIRVRSTGTNTPVVAMGVDAVASPDGYVGTQNNVPFGIRTNDVNRIWVTTAGNVGIGTTAPTSKLHVVGLPTSSSGLTAGAIWIDGTTLKIVT